MHGRLENRSEAGQLLGQALAAYARSPELIVLAIPPGGVPVAYEIATALTSPLDVFLVRRLRLPGHERITIGALASGGARVINEAVLAEFGASEEQVAIAAVAEARDEQLYRGSRPRPQLRGRTVVLVDDGLDAGTTTMRAAIAAIREQKPSRLVIAVPVGEWSVCAALEPEVDELVCLHVPEQLLALDLWYRELEPVRPQEARALLERPRLPVGRSHGSQAEPSSP